MQTVLQGPDGNAAIDKATGMPLTMEELLRRNGIVAMGNNVSMLGPQQAAGVSPAVVASTEQTPDSAVAATMKGTTNAGSSGGGSSSSTSPSTAQSTSDESKTFDQLSASGVDPSTLTTLEALGLVGAGTAAAYAAYRKMTKSGTNTPSRETANNPKGTPNIIDAEFSEVPAVRGNKAAQAIKGRSAATAIEGPRKQLPAPRSELAKVRAAQAAAGSANVDVIPAQGAMRTVQEAPEAGLSRFLGSDSKIVQMLMQNPGIARTLSRIP